MEIPFHRQMVNPVRLVVTVQVKRAVVVLMETVAPVDKITARMAVVVVGSIQVELTVLIAQTLMAVVF